MFEKRKIQKYRHFLSVFTCNQAYSSKYMFEYFIFSLTFQKQIILLGFVVSVFQKLKFLFSFELLEMLLNVFSWPILPQKSYVYLTFVFYLFVCLFLIIQIEFLIYLKRTHVLLILIDDFCMLFDKQDFLVTYHVKSSSHLVLLLLLIEKKGTF